MSGPKTLVLPRKKKKGEVALQQQSSAEAASREAIRERAYYKWEAAGCPCCDGVEFWLQAEAELAAKTAAVGEASGK